MDSDRETESPPLGECPVCESVIPRTGRHIVYETPESWVRMLAECPACEESVAPK